MATNTDRTLPSPRGPLPGNGSLVAVLRTALGREPDVVVGKPEPALFTTAASRSGAGKALVVGDRLDTDIEGAVRAGMDSLLVLTGVSGPAELLSAPPERRPTHVAADLAGLFDADRDTRILSVGDDAAGGWRLVREGPAVGLDGGGEAVHALRLLAGAVWNGADIGQVSGRSSGARDVLEQWGLPT
jgi:hypothetical protein